MKILKKIAIALATIILLFAIISFFLPSKAHVERSLVINAPAQIIFNQVNNLKKWEKWSPWEKLDPQMKSSYEGPEAGVGAKHSWQSENRNVGSGNMTITSVVPNQDIQIAMDFMEHGTAIGAFKFDNAVGGTKVTWSMKSDMGMNPVKKFFGLMMDKMVGNDFEKGLNSLKEIAEGMPVPPTMPSDSTSVDSTAVMQK